MEVARLVPLITQERLAGRVAELARAINQDYRGQELTVVCVLKGAFVFTADLIRHLDVPMSVEFMGVASYLGTRSTGHVRITSDLTRDVKDRHVLLVEDIIDSGKTIDYLVSMLRVREPRSLKICALLSKPHVHEMKQAIDYVGFEIGDEFVIGYGLDYDGAHRGLPYLAQMAGAQNST